MVSSDLELHRLSSKGSGGGGEDPVGTIVESLHGNLDPNAYLMCDGAELSRTLYPELFSAIGTLWGDGDGSTTFNIPKLDDGRSLRGAGVHDVGDYLDSSTKRPSSPWTMQTNSAGAHRHQVVRGATGSGVLGSNTVARQWGTNSLTSAYHLTSNGTSTANPTVGRTNNTGAHSHSVTLDGGDGETRASSLPVIMFIRWV